MALALASAGQAQAQAQAKIPDTPAGHTLATWLDVFNSGDRSRVETYVHDIDPSQTAEEMLSSRRHTNGFELVSIETSEPLHLRFIAKERVGSIRVLGDLFLREGTPAQVARLEFNHLPPGVTPVEVVLDEALRRKAIEGIDANLLDSYVDAATAHRMAEALLVNERVGEYRSFVDGNVFARRLTKDLQAISHDKHLEVAFNPYKSPPDAAPTQAEKERTRDQLEHENCAFEEVEVLPGNVGYLKLNAFSDPAVCAPTAAAAMGFLAHTDALIFDLRDNGGGDPVMVALLASYLFDRRTHLNDLYIRKGNTTRQYWTTPQALGAVLTRQPVYVLTSHRTFSGAEEFAYDLKALKRATIVGETSGGGAHPVSEHIVADYFVVGVPWGSAVNPVTRTNWEGSGVDPDVKVPATDALEAAEKLISEKRAEK